MAELTLVLLGPPGAGKGTQAKSLAAERALLYISTGDLLRAAVAAGSSAGHAAKRYLDAGELVPDKVVFEVLVETIQRQTVAGGVVLDGFPRTTAQATALESALERLERFPAAAILLDVPDEVLVRRLSGRRICAQHGHEYHVEYRPPIRAHVCDIDGSALLRREDDQPETIRRRLAVYREQTEPLVGFYEAAQRLSRINGDGDPSDVRTRLAAAVPDV